MSRRIRSINKNKLRYITSKKLRKFFPSELSSPGFRKECTSSKANELGCVGVVNYEGYVWGITKTGKACFCCIHDGFRENAWYNGAQIMNTFKPALEKLIKRKLK